MSGGQSVEKLAETQAGARGGETGPVVKDIKAGKSVRRNEMAVHCGVTEQGAGAEMELGKVRG